MASDRTKLHELSFSADGSEPKALREQVNLEAVKEAIYTEFDGCKSKCEISQMLIDELGEDLIKQLLSFLLTVKWGELRIVKTEGKVRETEVSEVLRKASPKKR